MTVKDKAKPEAKPSEYVVLERGRLNPDDEALGFYWVEVGETDTKKAGGTTEATVIEAVVGQREGTFKAVAKRAWKGGIKREKVETVRSEKL